VELEPYTYEEFREITKQLFSCYQTEEHVAGRIASTVWKGG